ncbi:class I SAM-dependent methyltransferase [Streptosporangium sp. NPDC051023]|uniref:class I SAM-dependent methyltransferase n=1 Tax=Streptosporangium sp. NPDC051023 TaxID=3155410 RepID=UPI003450495E
MPESLRRRTVRTVRAVSAAIAAPPWMPPGHFYSPLTAATDVKRALDWKRTPGRDRVPGVDLREAEQLALAIDLAEELDKPLAGPRYPSGHTQWFCAADAAVYRSMLWRHKPRRVMEIGSGFSTAVALDTLDRSVELTCVEPYPDRMLSLLRPEDSDRLTLLRSPVQDVPLEAYARLEAGDVLFIDSTHVAKAGSDVIWLFLQVLPRLAPGVIVHIHDIFWPFDYPDEWLREGRDWTEAYFLHAFLAGNSGYEILLFSSWLWQEHPELVPAPLATDAPGSIWLRRAG